MNGEICKSGRRVPALVAGGGGGGENPTRLRYGGGGGTDSCRGSKVKVTTGRRRQLSQTADMLSHTTHWRQTAKNLAEADTRSWFYDATSWSANKLIATTSELIEIIQIVAII